MSDPPATPAPAPPTPDHVLAFLSEHHGESVTDLEPLSGGFWSSAYGYRVGGRELVLRLGTVSEGFCADRAAMAFASADLPVPAVLDVGEALGVAYAISERHHGSFLEDVEPSLADQAGVTIVRLLAALYRVGGDRALAVDWQSERPDQTSWRQWLLHGLIDDPEARVHGWRDRLAEDATLDATYRACEERITELVERCPERRDLIHGDLLHGNVLLAEDASTVHAVFSWKCSVRGDFLYDVAWCSFWGAWHPGIAAADVWERVLREPTFVDDAALDDAAARHHCYQLHIGATHLGWYVWTGDAENLRAAARQLEALLGEGPTA